MLGNSIHFSLGAYLGVFGRLAKSAVHDPVVTDRLCAPMATVILCACV
jgi:hypothetical protein